MKRGLWFTVGILSIVGGVFALVNPLSATIAAEQLAGWLFFILGVLQLVALFGAVSTSGRVFAAFSGIIGVLVGLELLQEPLRGILALTMVIAVLFLATGLLKVGVAFVLRATVAFTPILLSGLISIALAVMIFMDYPKSAAVMLGVLLAVELISNGVSLIFYTRHIRD